MTKQLDQNIDALFPLLLLGGLVASVVALAKTRSIPTALMVPVVITTIAVARTVGYLASPSSRA